MEKLAEVLHGVAKVGAVDCTGKSERFCAQQGVRELPGVMLVIDGKVTPFNGSIGEYCHGRALRERLFSLPVRLTGCTTIPDHVFAYVKCGRCMQTLVMRMSRRELLHLCV